MNKLNLISLEFDTSEVYLSKNLTNSKSVFALHPVSHK